MEVLATLLFLVVGGICVAFLAVAGLLVVSFFKLLLIPVTVAFEAVKWVVLFVVVPIIVLVVIPVILLVVVPLLVIVLVPLMFGLALIASPFLLLAAAT